ncbi:hypothetical protein ACFRIC_40515 [Streptomyces sp. NPDC056738]|uniref:hypothetical protein n=1 Tax=Streptomyces sp. NPDC056738 TaxID=3345933 RepID=UPI003692DA75
MTVLLSDDIKDVPAKPPMKPGTPLAWDDLGLQSMSAMLVESLSRRGSRYYEALCQWPRWHALNERALAVTHHPLLMAESTRQLAAALELLYLQDAGADRLQPSAVSLGVDPRTQPIERGAATHVLVRVTVSDLVRRGGAVAAYRLTAEFFGAGTPFGTCRMMLVHPSCPGPEAASTPPPLSLLRPAPAAVGASAEPDVLIARGAQGRLVIAPCDPGHPVLLPGRPALLPALAVMEAGRQATLLSQGVLPSAVVGIAVRLDAPVPSRGAVVEVAAEDCASRFVVKVGEQTPAAGTVTLLRP